MVLLVPAFPWRISSASGVITRGTSPEIALFRLPPLRVETVAPEVVVEVEDVAEEAAPSWLLWMLEAVCKVLFSTMVYPVGCYLILVHPIHLFLDSFA